MKEFKDYTEVEKNLLLRLHEWFKLTKSHYIKNLDNSIIDTRLLKSPSLNVLFNVLTKKLLDNNIITTDMKLIPTLDLYESREFNSSLVLRRCLILREYIVKYLYLQILIIV